jgi:hypothetical protein
LFNTIDATILAKKRDILQEGIDQRKDRLLKAFQISPFSVYKNCEKAGVNPTTFYRYLKEDPEFSAKIDACKNVYNEDLLDLADNTHKEALNDRDENGRVSQVALNAANYIKNNLGKSRGYNVKEQSNDTDTNQAIEAMNRYAKIIENALQINEPSNDSE